MSDFTYFFQFTPFGKSVSDQWDNLTSEIQYIAVVCQLIVFPFYVYVHKANNIRDREVCSCFAWASWRFLFLSIIYLFTVSLTNWRLIFWRFFDVSSENWKKYLWVVEKTKTPCKLQMEEMAVNCGNLVPREIINYKTCIKTKCRCGDQNEIPDFMLISDLTKY